MSILLDSLKQKQGHEGGIVPSVHNSHFDDEMLNDDALIKSNQLWKLTSVFLFITLSISWVYFYLENSHNRETSTNISARLTEDKSINEQTKKLIKQNVTEAIESNANRTDIIKPSAVMGNNKNDDGYNNSRNNQYKPKKRETLNDSFNRVNTSNKETIQKNKSSLSISNSNFSNKPYSSVDAIFYEELSTELLMELPNLDIGSYAVSNNPKKSFIVLNDSFYSEGEAISPNLKLLSIDKNNVLFRYKSQLIKKNYK